MNEFVLIFRNDFHPEAKFSPDQMQAIMKQWQNWMGGMAAQRQTGQAEVTAWVQKVKRLSPRQCGYQWPICRN